MKKEEKIKEVFGVDYEYFQNRFGIDENGYTRYDGDEKRYEKHNPITKPRSDGTRWRPYLLHGIETNNDWIEITCDDDLPKEDCHCWIMDKEKGVQSGLWKQAPNELLHKQACFFWLKKATHYQIIAKPKPPVY